MTGKVLPVVLLAALPSLPWRPHLPVWAERWLHNPRERTERAIEAWEAGEPERAVEPAETALRLAPEDPRTGFNAGTAHLGAGHARRAAGILEKAAEAAGPELAPTAWYNLGNSRLGSGNSADAVEAYKQALRANPGDTDAKFNLELALREQEKQQQQGAGGGSRGGGGRKGEKPSSQRPGGENPNDQKSKGPQSPGQSGNQGQQGQQRSQGQDGQRQQPSSQQSGGQSPRFQDQPEMSEQEARALLSAVENLERRHRRDEAAKRAQQKSTQEKDW